jgi:hypothetical protein
VLFARAPQMTFLPPTYSLPLVPYDVRVRTRYAVEFPPYRPPCRFFFVDQGRPFPRT